MSVMAPVSWGELIDKITILEIKQARIAEAAKRRNVERELAALTDLREAAMPANAPAEIAALTVELRHVNTALWEVEDALRDCERDGRFDAGFIELARSVYRHNDRRAALKKEINLALGSELVEEKSYAAY